jgi:23S rRNA (cytosine1962-C5)-methyltransferase
MLNRLDLSKMRLVAANFFSQAAAFKRSGTLFDCVIVDPPFFSTTNKGVVDLANESARLINKARPLVKDGGRLIVINNALYLSGAQFMQTLEKLCASGYLAIDALLPVPPDITGFAETIQSAAPADPAPFNHPTKIVILSVKRKSQY